MDTLHVALGTAVTITVAAVATLWRIVLYVREIDIKQTDWRHDLRSELGGCILESEERVTRRIERLEGLSYGFRRSHLGDPGGGDGSD